MNPNDAKVIAEFLLGDLKYEISTTASVFAAVPAGAIDYRPDPKTRSAIELIRHITIEDEWLLNSVADGVVVPPPDDSEKCGLNTPAAAVAQYTVRMGAVAERLGGLSGAALAKEVEFFGTKLPAVSILSMMMRHSSHHRGQLSSYLRAMGGKVPDIYGPSGDSASA